MSEPAEKRLPPLFFLDPPNSLGDNGGEITLEQPPRPASEHGEILPVERDADLGRATWPRTTPLHGTHCAPMVADGGETPLASDLRQHSAVRVAPQPAAKLVAEILDRHP